MKKHIHLAVLTAISLSACGTIDSTHTALSTHVQQMNSVYRLDNHHWTYVAKIRAEANRLGTQVASGSITKVQAAQMLNRFRLNLIGRNSVDDSVYEVYQQAAVDSQRGVISAEQSKAYIENALRGWQQRWPNMSNKPSNPAFTNFLLEYMGMQPLK